MVGSTSRLQLPRLLYLPSRAPQTRLICVHTPEPGPATSFADVPRHLNSGSHPWCSGRLCARGCGCLSCESTCECGAALGRCGRLKSRATAPERTSARVCREVGDTTVAVLDERSVEVLASGLPMHHGAQLAVDITFRSAVTSFGRLAPMLPEPGRCHLVVVGLETGGRWSSRHGSRVCVDRRSWDGRRWIRMLSCSRAFASSLLSSRDDVWEGTDGATPDLAHLFGHGR